MMRFIGQYPVLGAPGAFPFLSADFLDPGTFAGGTSFFI